MRHTNSEKLTLKGTKIVNIYERAKTEIADNHRKFSGGMYARGKNQLRVENVTNNDQS